MISWTDVACSVVPCESACDADETCDEAATSALAAERTLINDVFTGGDNFVQGVSLTWDDGASEFAYLEPGGERALLELAPTPSWHELQFRRA